MNIMLGSETTHRLIILNYIFAVIFLCGYVIKKNSTCLQARPVVLSCWGGNSFRQPWQTDWLSDDGDGLCFKNVIYTLIVRSEKARIIAIACQHHNL